MTVTVETIFDRLTANGIQTVFPFTFEALQAGDIDVYLDDILQGGGYVIAINSNGVGGTVTFTPAPDDGVIVDIFRTVDLTQETALPVEGNLPEQTLETMSDKLTMICQQLAEKLSRAFIVPFSLASTFVLPLPDALKLIRWNAAADSLENVDPQDIIDETLIQAGAGNVVGPDVAVDSAPALFDGTTGRLLKVGALVELGTNYRNEVAWGTVDNSGSNGPIVLYGADGGALDTIGTQDVTAVDANGRAQYYSSDSAAFGGFRMDEDGTDFGIRADWHPSVSFVMRVGDDIADARYWVGLFSDDPTGSDDPSVKGAAFCYSTNTDGTAFWRTWTRNSASNRQATTSPIAASGRYKMRIDFVDATTVQFYMDDVLIATHTTQIPTADTSLVWYLAVTKLDSAEKLVAIENVKMIYGV